MREPMRDYISAKYLLAPPPPATTIIPDDFRRYIQYIPAKVARGARKRQGGAIVGTTSPRHVGMARLNTRR